MPVYELASKKKKRSAAVPSKTAEPEEDAAKPKATSKPKSKSTPTPVNATTATAAQTASAPTSNATDASAERPTIVEFSEPAQWVERMALTSTRPLPTDLNADDDPKREEAFIQQALLSVSRGVALLDAAGVPCQRPDDYYAEMYKDDVQMSRIAKAMDESKARIEEQAHRRAMKDQKKYGKEVQAEVLRQRAKYKRDMNDRLSEWRRKRRGNEELRDILDDGDEEKGNPRSKRNGGPAAKRQRVEGAPQPRNVRPGGAARNRPGKNARNRR